MISYMKSMLFWIAFWMFYVVAFVLGITAILIVYIFVAPIALYELLLHLAKRIKL